MQVRERPLRRWRAPRPTDTSFLWLDGAMQSHLLHVQRPIARVPSLAIHLNRSVNTEGLQFNQETHLAAVLATETRLALEGNASAASDKDSKRLAAPLRLLLGRELGCSPDDILDFDLCLADSQPCAIGGVCEEFVFAPRLDNLFSCHTAVEAFIASLDDGSMANEEHARLVVLFDHEEVSDGCVWPALMNFLLNAVRNRWGRLRRMARPPCSSRACCAVSSPRAARTSLIRPLRVPLS